MLAVSREPRSLIKTPGKPLGDVDAFWELTLNLSRILPKKLRCSTAGASSSDTTYYVRRESLYIKS
jgi:hypothetical protein